MDFCKYTCLPFLYYFSKKIILNLNKRGWWWQVNGCGYVCVCVCIRLFWDKLVLVKFPAQNRAGYGQSAATEPCTEPQRLRSDVPSGRHALAASSGFAVSLSPLPSCFCRSLMRDWCEVPPTSQLRFSESSCPPLPRKTKLKKRADEFFLTKKLHFIKCRCSVDAWESTHIPKYSLWISWLVPWRPSFSAGIFVHFSVVLQQPRSSSRCS